MLYSYIGKYPLQSGYLPSWIYALRIEPPLLWVDRRGFYLFRFFLSWREVSNATTSELREMILSIIPRTIVMISKNVISVTSLPGIPIIPVKGSGGYHPVMGTFVLLFNTP